MKILTKLKQAQLKYIFIFIVLCIILVFIFRPRNTKKTTLNPIKNIPIAPFDPSIVDGYIPVFIFNVYGHLYMPEKIDEPVVQKKLDSDIDGFKWYVYRTPENTCYLVNLRNVCYIGPMSGDDGDPIFAVDEKSPFNITVSENLYTISSNVSGKFIISGATHIEQNSLSSYASRNSFYIDQNPYSSPIDGWSPVNLDPTLPIIDWSSLPLSLYPELINPYPLPIFPFDPGLVEEYQPMYIFNKNGFLFVDSNDGTVKYVSQQSLNISTIDGCKWYVYEDAASRLCYIVNLQTHMYLAPMIGAQEGDAIFLDDQKSGFSISKVGMKYYMASNVSKMYMISNETEPNVIQSGVLNNSMVNESWYIDINPYNELIPINDRPIIDNTLKPLIPITDHILSPVISIWPFDPEKIDQHIPVYIFNIYGYLHGKQGCMSETRNIKSNPCIGLSKITQQQISDDELESFKWYIYRDEYGFVYVVNLKSMSYLVPIEDGQYSNGELGLTVIKSNKCGFIINNVANKYVLHSPLRGYVITGKENVDLSEFSTYTTRNSWYIQTTPYFNDPNRFDDVNIDPEIPINDWSSLPLGLVPELLNPFPKNDLPIIPFDPLIPEAHPIFYIYNYHGYLYMDIDSGKVILQKIINEVDIGGFQWYAYRDPITYVCYILNLRSKKWLCVDIDTIQNGDGLYGCANRSGFAINLSDDMFMIQSLVSGKYIISGQTHVEQNSLSVYKTRNTWLIKDNPYINVIDRYTPEEIDPIMPIIDWDNLPLIQVPKPDPELLWPYTPVDPNNPPAHPVYIYNIHGYMYLPNDSDGPIMQEMVNIEDLDGFKWYVYTNMMSGVQYIVNLRSHKHISIGDSNGLGDPINVGNSASAFSLNAIGNMYYIWSIESNKYIISGINHIQQNQLSNYNSCNKWFISIDPTLNNTIDNVDIHPDIPTYLDPVLIPPPPLEDLIPILNSSLGSIDHLKFYIYNRYGYWKHPNDAGGKLTQTQMDHEKLSSFEFILYRMVIGGHVYIANAETFAHYTTRESAIEVYTQSPDDAPELSAFSMEQLDDGGPGSYKIISNSLKYLSSGFNNIVVQSEYSPDSIFDDWFISTRPFNPQPLYIFNPYGMYMYIKPNATVNDQIEVRLWEDNFIDRQGFAWYLFTEENETFIVHIRSGFYISVGAGMNGDPVYQGVFTRNNTAFTLTESAGRKGIPVYSIESIKTKNYLSYHGNDAGDVESLLNAGVVQDNTSMNWFINSEKYTDLFTYGHIEDPDFGLKRPGYIFNELGQYMYADGTSIKYKTWDMGETNDVFLWYISTPREGEPYYIQHVNSSLYINIHDNTTTLSTAPLSGLNMSYSEPVTIESGNSARQMIPRYFIENDNARDSVLTPGTNNSVVIEHKRTNKNRNHWFINTKPFSILFPDGLLGDLGDVIGDTINPRYIYNDEGYICVVDDEIKIMEYDGQLNNRFQWYIYRINIAREMMYDYYFYNAYSHKWLMQSSLANGPLSIGAINEDLDQMTFVIKYYDEHNQMNKYKIKSNKNQSFLTIKDGSELTTENPVTINGRFIIDEKIRVSDELGAIFHFNNDAGPYYIFTTTNKYKYIDDSMSSARDYTHNPTNIDGFKWYIYRHSTSNNDYYIYNHDVGYISKCHFERSNSELEPYTITTDGTYNGVDLYNFSNCPQKYMISKLTYDELFPPNDLDKTCPSNQVWVENQGCRFPPNDLDKTCPSNQVWKEDKGCECPWDDEWQSDTQTCIPLDELQEIALNDAIAKNRPVYIHNSNGYVCVYDMFGREVAYNDRVFQRSIAGYIDKYQWIRYTFRGNEYFYNKLKQGHLTAFDYQYASWTDEICRTGQTRTSCCAFKVTNYSNGSTIVSNAWTTARGLRKKGSNSIEMEFGTADRFTISYDI